MTTASPWETGQRDVQYQGRYYVDSSHAPQPPAATTEYQSSRRRLPSLDSYYSQAGEWKSAAESEHPQTRELPSLTGTFTDASTYRTRLHERHTPPSGNPITTSPSRQTFASPWHSLPVDQRLQQERPLVDAPLTLNTHDLPKVASHSGYTTDGRSYGTTSTSRSQHTTTSLPSFASLQEQTSRSEDPDEVEIAPMSSRLSCYLCTKLKPLVQDIAISVAELDENVQTYCSQSVTRTLDIPRDSPVRAGQWVLERLAKAKSDLQAASRRALSGYYYSQPSGAAPGYHPQSSSPPNPLKRPADRWDQEDYADAKRLRPSIAAEEVQRTTSAPSFKDDRRTSIDYAGRSPPPTESVAGSTYPRAGSPALSARPNRTLPSPSSLAYPPSGAPSLAAPTAPSVGSPSTSYQPAVSIHTASTSSATSAHIADLQHQVTLKSLSLQTLQSEYASLLQKLQRERVKSQTIEKKTTVADQEVNELTSKNEELTEQVKSLESQLEASEKKREAEREEASREKEQWGRMLDMGGRIQNKHAAEKQKLEDEIKSLTDRVAAYEAEGGMRPGQPEKLQELSGRISLESGSGTETPIGNGGVMPIGVSGNDVASLKREIAMLQSRIEVLHFSLEEARRHNQFLDQGAREIVERSGEIRNVINRSLDDGTLFIKLKEKESTQYDSAESRRSTPGRQKPNWSPNLMQQPGTPLLKEPSRSPQGEGGRKPSQSTAASSLSTATMASITRAKSPSPAELGFHVAPSTSSPEELIRALGPLPTAPPFQFGEQHFRQGTDFQGSGGNPLHPHYQQQRKYSNPWTAPSISEMQQANVNLQLASFRPLSHHVPSPYASVTRIAEQVGTSPRSYHSSPGPIMDNSSPTSSGSGSRRSSAKDVTRSGEASLSISTLVSFPHENSNGSNAPAASMPPPPRPSAGTANFDG